MYLELSLLVVFNDAVILTCSSVDAVADAQDRGEQGAGKVVTDLNGQLDRLGAEGSPCQGAFTWCGKHMTGKLAQLMHYITLHDACVCVVCVSVSHRCQ